MMIKSNVLLEIFCSEHECVCICLQENLLKIGKEPWGKRKCKICQEMKKLPCLIKV